MKLPKIDIKVSITKGDTVLIDKPEKVVSVLREIFNSDTINWTEEMIMVCLNRANHVIGYYKVAAGGFAGVVCDPRVIMTIAINCAASGVILAHNHPSGNLKPSKADLDVTEKVKKALQYLDISLVDHFILTDDKYYSFMEMGDI